MKTSVSITEAESVVMNVLWQRNPRPAEDIMAALEDEETWHVSTVKTLLSRLVKKGAIRARREGRRYLYSPIIDRDQWLSDESSGLLDRLFHGRIAPFVAHFSHSRKLSKRDIEELKDLIRALDNER
jgi:BlaI family penicillinase repressor